MANTHGVPPCPVDHVKEERRRSSYGFPKGVVVVGVDNGDGDVVSSGRWIFSASFGVVGTSSVLSSHSSVEPVHVPSFPSLPAVDICKEVLFFGTRFF